MKHSRRDVLKASSIALAGTAGLAATTGTVAASHVGVDAPVLSSVDLNVRDEPSTSGSRIATADQWTGGEVVDGPVGQAEEDDARRERDVPEPRGQRRARGEGDQERTDDDPRREQHRRPERSADARRRHRRDRKSVV